MAANTIITTIFAWLAISPAQSQLAPIVRQLDSPVWAVRQKSESDLRCRLSWPVALWLERQLPSLSAEGRARVHRLLVNYWYGWQPGYERMPYIDALNVVNFCSTPNTPLVQRYLDRVGWINGGEHYPYLRYRLATHLLVEDLIALRIPPPLIRPMLEVMELRSRAWDKRYSGRW